MTQWLVVPVKRSVLLHVESELRAEDPLLRLLRGLWEDRGGLCPCLGSQEGSLEEVILWWRVDEEVESVTGRESCWRWEGMGYLQMFVFIGHQSQILTGLTMPDYTFGICLVGASQGALDGVIKF